MACRTRWSIFAFVLSCIVAMVIRSHNVAHFELSPKLIISTFTSILSIIMNLQQLEYILAVDKTRHFVTAAKSCYVTQATLSMMIRKLEEELGARIFDRSKVPVIPTEVGKKIIAQARIILLE